MKDERLIVALDTDSKKAKSLVKKLSTAVGIFKVGSQLFTACGPEIVEYINKNKAKVFLDLKFHDIPNTVAKSAIECAKMGVFMFNVHALGGYEMMKKARHAVKAASKKYGSKRPRILAVTVLTSMNDNSLKAVGVNKSVNIEVIRLTSMAKRAGLDGVIASPKEAHFIRREFGKDFLIVTPGVRPLWSAKATDQKRVLTPKQAIDNGANYIVVGRPVLEAKDPRRAAERILGEI